MQTVKELIYKRGYGKVNKDRIPLTDNAIVEQVPLCGPCCTRISCPWPLWLSLTGRGEVAAVPEAHLSSLHPVGGDPAHCGRICHSRLLQRSL